VKRGSDSEPNAREKYFAEKKETLIPNSYPSEEARRIFDPMLAGYARGEFQGFCADGRSRDWRDWRGGCHGYEGLLVDNYHALLAVLDNVKAKR
jgi:hypothetical protein